MILGGIGNEGESPEQKNRGITRGVCSILWLQKRVSLANIEKVKVVRKTAEGQAQLTRSATRRLTFESSGRAGSRRVLCDFLNADDRNQSRKEARMINPMYSMGGN